ncbi:family 2A encapsulin nanocompartment cargo protein cysteine desulfurase [Zavarzinia compransoris]|uniref:family 2A encapsulin nanocompartment cargo protein cysteine desulfurase n=1 Tax=Zavarzinia compransoris TaxID=1264899 RepID=UPI001FB69DBE|nr:family 2A encapsulin nanocompartment cargo protein cysteine desulfurase [Zavarzinia compransoris]
MPDEGLIQQLANAFFTALPGGTPAAASLPGAGAALPSAPAYSPDLVLGHVPGPAPTPPLTPNGNPGIAAVLPPLAGAAQPSIPGLGQGPAFATPDLTRVLQNLGDHLAFVPRLDTPAVTPAPEPPPRHAPAPLVLDLGPLAVQHRPELVPPAADGPRPFDPALARRDFPILHQNVNGKPLIWLDNAATTQKPQAVIDRLVHFYAYENSNIHRAAHTLAARATDAYEAAREKVRRFLNAPSAKDIIFVRGATEGLNLLAQAYGRQHVGPGDEIVVTHLEHHANIVPWQQLATEKGARLRVVPVDDSGQIRLDAFQRLLGPKTKIVSITQVSNALGTVTPAREMVAIARRYGAATIVDGAQAVSHMPVDVQVLDADFYVFSGHKVFGPTGIGAVYGRAGVLETMQPWQGGGNMIADVTFERTVFQDAPERFEAGTGNIADAVGLGAALDYLAGIGMHNVAAHEHALIEYGTEALLSIPGLRLIGTAREKAGVLSFVLDGCATADVGKALASEGIAVRAGHHCAQPILRRFGVEATVRPSFALYNTFEDIDALVDVLRRLQSGRGHGLSR